jgi:hypothetical protein
MKLFKNAYFGALNIQIRKVKTKNLLFRIDTIMKGRLQYLRVNVPSWQRCQSLIQGPKIAPFGDLTHFTRPLLGL